MLLFFLGHAKNALGRIRNDFSEFGKIFWSRQRPRPVSFGHELDFFPASISIRALGPLCRTLYLIRTARHPARLCGQIWIGLS